MTTAPIVLVADRNDGVLKHLKNELGTTDYVLLHARNGQEALSIIGNQEYIAAAVVELELPGVNGLDLIGRLSSKQPKPKKIIATTFLEHELLVELATQMGGDAIVRKPTRKKGWFEIVRSLLRRSAELTQ